MDERSLLTLLQKRPNEGMKELMRQYMGYCYYIVRNKLAEFPQEDIEECVSDVLWTRIVIGKRLIWKEADFVYF